MQIKADVFNMLQYINMSNITFTIFYLHVFSSLTVSPKQIQSGPVYFIKAVSIKLTNNK